MRIDKYLWSIRYFKTRNKATEACKKGHVSINGKKVKPSREVFVDDRISLRKNQINYEIEVLDFPKNRVGAKLVALYCRDITPKEAFAHTELVAFAQSYYRKKGSGRPTKKDRRALEDFSNENPQDDSI